MGFCCVPGCSHENRTHKCRMFSFPLHLSTRRKWQEAVRRATGSPRKLHLASPKRHDRACSCHFHNGNKDNGPTLFPWNTMKRFHPPTPEKIRRLKQSARFAVRRLNLDESSEMPPPTDLPTEDLEGDSMMSTSHISPPLPPNYADVAVQTNQPTHADFTVQTDCPAVDDRYNEILKGLAKKIQDLQADNSSLKTKVTELQEKLLKSTTVLHAAENTILRSELAKLQEDVQDSKSIFHFEKIADKEELVAHFIGLPNKETFYALLRLFDGIYLIYKKGWQVKRLSKKDQLFLTLLKLRRGLSNHDLAVRFAISKEAVANVFLTFLMALHHLIAKNLLHIPSRAKIQTSLPECLKNYESTRIVVDCTEVTTANPTLLSDQSKMYSPYKNKVTSKALVAVLPDGTVAFVSDLYPSSISDRAIIIDTGILDLLVPGDSIMADKGFNIGDLMPDEVALNIPPFKDAPEFTEEQIDETFSIATARIHIERENIRIKHFQLLQFIPQFMVPYASEVFRVCAALTNFQMPMIKHVDGEE